MSKHTIIKKTVAITAALAAAAILTAATFPNIPAKLIAVDLESTFDEEWGDLAIFGPKEYIETDKPEPMSRADYSAWLAWKTGHLL